MKERMKKIFATTLASVMSLSFAACNVGRAAAETAKRAQKNLILKYGKNNTNHALKKVGLI